MDMRYKIAMARMEGRPVPVDAVFRPVIPQAKKKPCGGCEKRKAWLNSVIPGAGDVVEWVTEATGIKAMVESRVTESETGTSDTQERHHPEFGGPLTSESRPSQGFDS